MAKSDLLSYGTISDQKEQGGRHIVCLSGGLSSAWVAWWVKENVTGEIIYYFNDTKWEHADLYRFLDDISSALNIEILYDSDGRDPEQVFYDEKMLGSNRTPICSRILKAERLQKYAKSGDTLYFGIEGSEVHRAARITPIYARLSCLCRFPLIDQRVEKMEMYTLINDLGVDIPQLYIDGFSHNNCAGGCVRAGKSQWKALFHEYPDVYAERERVEREFTEWNNKRRLENDKGYNPREYHFMKDMSLSELRYVIENQLAFDFGDPEEQGECVGVCGRMY